MAAYQIENLGAPGLIKGSHQYQYEKLIFSLVGSCQLEWRSFSVLLSEHSKVHGWTFPSNQIAACCETLYFPRTSATSGGYHRHITRHTGDDKVKDQEVLCSLSPDYSGLFFVRTSFETTSIY